MKIILNSDEIRKIFEEYANKMTTEPLCGLSATVECSDMSIGLLENDALIEIELGVSDE